MQMNLKGVEKLKKGFMLITLKKILVSLLFLEDMFYLNHQKKVLNEKLCSWPGEFKDGSMIFYESEVNEFNTRTIL